MNSYNEKYSQDKLYWGSTPSDLCYRVLKLVPPTKPLQLLDIGCGEGRNAIFFARNGYDVSGFDISQNGVGRVSDWAAQLRLKVDVYRANLVTHRLDRPYEIIFSTGTLHYIPPALRDEVMFDIRSHTLPGGLNAFSVFVEKPFIPRAPDAETNSYHWKSGMLLGYYHDWLIEFSEEMIFDCNSGGVPHRHAVNRIIARRSQE